jgi:hypothetical protein
LNKQKWKGIPVHRTTYFVCLCFYPRSSRRWLSSNRSSARIPELLLPPASLDYSGLQCQYSYSLAQRGIIERQIVGYLSNMTLVEIVLPFSPAGGLNLHRNTVVFSPSYLLLGNQAVTILMPYKIRVAALIAGRSFRCHA